MNWIGVHWLGAFTFLLSLFLIADIVILIGKVTRIIPSPTPPNIRIWSVSIVVLLTTALILYGKYNAEKIRHVSYDIKLKETALPEKMKIVMIADLHFGYIAAEKSLPKIIQGINAEKPDIVCIVGDIFNDDINFIQDPTAVIDLFKSIKTKYGVYACLGNHDSGETFPEMMSLLEQSNIMVLKDEHVKIDDRIVLVGRLDKNSIGGFDGLERTDTADVLESIDTKLPIVVMDHNPAYSDEYGNEIDLLLSGHTHRGQFIPITLITKSMYTVDYGHYQNESDSPHVVITSGASTWGTPIRIGTNNEIVSINLQ